jgi:hypothetical protein
MAEDYSRYLNAGYYGANPGGGININPLDPNPDYRQLAKYNEEGKKHRSSMIKQGLMSGAYDNNQLQQLITQGDLNFSDLTAMGDYNKSAMDRKQQELELAKQQFELDKKRGFDASGRPIQKDWESMANADGTMKDQFKVKDWQNVNANTGALDLLRQNAMRGPGEMSQGNKLLMDSQKAQQAALLDQTAKSGAMNMLRAQSDLAQSGGLSGAARERMARSGMKNDLIAKQQVNRQGMLDRMGIQSKDEEQRIGALNQLQGMDNQQADFQFKNQQQAGSIQEANVRNSLNEGLQKRAWDANAYSQAMAEWGAGKTADAQSRAARSSGGKK